MRSAKKYGLIGPRASPGKARKPSYWYPAPVASWLIDKKHLREEVVRRMLEKHFPDVDTTLI